jgi:hypothetical protein
MLALLSDDQMAGVMRRGELGRGALEQLCIASTEGEKEEIRTASESITPAWLVTHIRDVRRLPLNNSDLSLKDIFSSNIELPPDLRIAHFYDGVERQLHEFEETLREIARDSGRRYAFPMGLGACQTLRRLCVSMAAWADHECPVITAAMVDWCGQYVQTALTQFLDAYNRLSSDSGTLDGYQSTVSYIHDAGPDGITQREIIQRCRAFRALDREKREDLLNTLLLDDAITSLQQGKKTLYISTSFVKTVANEPQENGTVDNEIPKCRQV